MQERVDGCTESDNTIPFISCGDRTKVAHPMDPHPKPIIELELIIGSDTRFDDLSPQLGMRCSNMGMRCSNTNESNNILNTHNENSYILNDGDNSRNIGWPQVDYQQIQYEERKEDY